MSDTRIINISKIIANDCYEISKSFEEQQWQKPIEQYIQYMDDQNTGLIDVLLAILLNWFLPLLFFKAF